MAWAYVAVALGLGVLAAWWLHRRAYRGAGDTVSRDLSPAWLPVLTVLGAVTAGPFYAHRPVAVVLTYLLALVWGSVLTVGDLEVRRLPDVLVLPAYPVVAGLLAVCSVSTHDGAALLRAAACAGAAVALFYLAALLSPGAEGLGLGDVKLAGVLGALLGWISWMNALMGLLSGFILGGVLALFLLIVRRADRRSFISFGPAMILGAYVWCLLPAAT